jgi:hypothetical protein
MKGWHKENFRHSLSARGITTTKMASSGTMRLNFSSIESKEKLDDLKRQEKYLVYLVKKGDVDPNELKRVQYEIDALKQALTVEELEERYPGYTGPEMYAQRQVKVADREAIEDAAAALKKVKEDEIVFIEAKLKGSLSEAERIEAEAALEALKYGPPKQEINEVVHLDLIKPIRQSVEYNNASDEEVKAYSEAFRKMIKDVKESESKPEYNMKVRLLENALEDKGSILDRGGKEALGLKREIGAFMMESSKRHKPQEDQFLEMDPKRHSTPPVPKQVEVLDPESKALFMKKFGREIKFK